MYSKKVILKVEYYRLCCELENRMSFFSHLMQATSQNINQSSYAKDGFDVKPREMKRLMKSSKFEFEAQILK